MAFETNVYVTSTLIAKEQLRQLENNLGVSKVVNRDWENKFSKDGETLGIRKPNKFRMVKARARAGVALAEANITLTVATQAHVSFEWSSKEMTDTVERVSERYVKPAMSALANGPDVDLFALYKKVANSVGTPGVAPADFDVYADAMRKLDEEATPGDMRHVFVNPKGKAETLKGLKGLLSDKIVNGVITKGFIGSLAELDFHMAQNVQTHTCGHFATGSTPVVDGATQTGATLATLGWGAAGTILEGDVFTIAGCYAVNPKTGASTGELRQFVVTENAVDDGAAGMNIKISPSIITSGAYQTCDSSPVDTTELDFVGTEDVQYPQSLAFHKDAFTLAIRPIEIPSSVVWGARESYEGLSSRVIKSYDPEEDKEVVRFDILYGVLCQYPELCCRIWG